MKNIRIGNDIHIRWRVMRGGDDEDFGGKHVSVLLRDQAGGIHPVDFEVTGNVIECTFWGRMQTRTGEYSLTLMENAGKEGMVTVDRTQVFRLVARQNSVVSGGAGTGCCCGGAAEVETVELTTELQVPSLGKGVVRVYNIARGAWGAGLVSDGEQVSVRIAPDSADVLSADEEGLHVDVSAIGGGGGVQAITDEEIRSLWGGDPAGSV